MIQQIKISFVHIGGSILDVNFKIKTYFKIQGDFQPSEITDLLKITPEKQWCKGDLRQNRPNDVYSFSMWACGAVATKNYFYVEKQLEKTLEQLKDKIEILNGIREKHNVKFVLEVVVKFYDCDEKPVISPGQATIDFCHATGTQLDYDYYFLFDTAVE